MPCWYRTAWSYLYCRNAAIVLAPHSADSFVFLWSLDNTGSYETVRFASFYWNSAVFTQWETKKRQNRYFFLSSLISCFAFFCARPPLQFGVWTAARPKQYIKQRVYPKGSKWLVTLCSLKGWQVRISDGNSPSLGKVSHIQPSRKTGAYLIKISFTGLFNWVSHFKRLYLDKSKNLPQGVNWTTFCTKTAAQIYPWAQSESIYTRFQMIYSQISFLKAFIYIFFRPIQWNREAPKKNLTSMYKWFLAGLQSSSSDSREWLNGLRNIDLRCEKVYWMMLKFNRSQCHLTI